MTIDRILDESNELSPMNTILKALKLFESGKSDKKILTKTQRELCLLADLIKVFLRDQFKYFQNNYSDLKNQDNYIEMIHSHLESIKKLQERMEWLANKFSNPQIPNELHEAFQFADEYISLQIEEWITKSLEFFKDKVNEETENLMIEIIERELKHRENIRSLLLVHENDTNEIFTYQEGILKKYVQSVLYLDKKKKDPRSRSLEIFYSVAAGIAMFFSLFFGFLILSYFAMYSIPFIIATGVIYMLKDRIKENIRSMSQKAVGSIFPDQRIDIVDGFNKE
ncbi:MAG: hypothetical protein ACFFDF_23575, partial [Candidatus Odinarchaeota archaeon]